MLKVNKRGEKKRKKKKEKKKRESAFDGGKEGNMASLLGFPPTINMLSGWQINRAMIILSRVQLSRRQVGKRRHQIHPSYCHCTCTCVSMDNTACIEMLGPGEKDRPGRKKNKKIHNYVNINNPCLLTRLGPVSCWCGSLPVKHE